MSESGLEEPLLRELRERLINIEHKSNELLRRVPDPGLFQGHADQRYGHLTYSQHGEDLVVVALFERLGVERPTYLDIGANHPINCSNTALLHSRGSRGVNVDASPDVISVFQRDRPDDVNVNVGVAGRAGRMIFYRIDAYSGRNSFSRASVEQVIAEVPGLALTDQIDIDVVTLDQLIAAHCGGVYPDFVSVDAEGFDYDILEAASFATRPHVLCVETLSGSGEVENKMDALLVKRGFRKCIQMFANGIYVNVDGPL